jgi:hypothetical protein
MARRFRLAILIVAGFAALASFATATSTAKPRAHAAKVCRYNGRNYSYYHYSYLTYLAVSKTSCDTGRYLAHKHGHVSGWRCTRKTLDHSPTQWDGSVSCWSRGRHVVWSFAQNTG